MDRGNVEGEHMQRFQAQAVINRPIDTVFAYITDIERLKQSMAVFRAEEYALDLGGSGVSHTTLIPPVRQEKEGPLQVGTTFRQSNGSLDHPLEATMEVIEFEPPDRLALKTMSKLETKYTRYVLESLPEGTRLTQTIETKSENVFANLFNLFSYNMAQQQLNQDLTDLKQQLET